MARYIFRLLVLSIFSSSAIWSADAQILIKDINPGPNGSTIKFGKIVGNKLYFNAYDSKTADLWVSDRETDSTYMIGPVLPGLDGTPNNESHFLAFRDSLLVFTTYFNSNDVNLFSTNGSLEGTQFIKTLAQGRNIMYDLVGFNNKFYFQGYDATHRTELWESDGTESGTHHLLNSLTGKPASSPINFTTYNNRLWFTSLGQPWYIDGDSLKLADSYYPNTTNYSLKLFTSSDTEPAYFVQPYNNSLNKRLVKVNPDASMEVIDTVLRINAQILAYKNQHLIYSETNNEINPYIADINSLNTNTGAISLLTSFSVTNSIGTKPGWVEGNNNVFLSVNIGGFMELWVTDGSTSGTSKIDFAPGSTGQTIYFIDDTENGGNFSASGNIFFNAGIDGSDQQLWISDGTESGTERIEVDGQPIKFSNYGFHHYANGIVFIASHPDYGNEIFYSDGTKAGTKLLADIIPGTKSPFSYTLGIISDTLFLVSTPSTAYGPELYALPIDLCEDIVCPEGFECVYGECLPIDYCAEVLCPEGQVCYEGGCFEGCLDGSCLELGPNLAAGHNATIELDAGTGYDVYEWSTGENEQKIKVKTSGRYWVTAYNLAGGYFGSDTLSVIFECGPQGECPEGFECIDGYCINNDPCAEVNCPEGQVCFEGGCFAGCVDNSTSDLCLFGQEFVTAPCENVICPEGEVCFEGGCFPSNCTDVECPVGTACYEGECLPTCFEEGGVYCPDGQTCYEGVCINPCDYVQCPEGQVCYEGGCFEGCLGADCIYLGPNLSATHSTTIILDAGSGFDIYEWSTGDTTQTVLVDQSGRYWVIAYNLSDNTYSSDTISVIFECNPQGECPEGFNCVDGYCINTDLCIDVLCPSGEACFQGGCYPTCLEDDNTGNCQFGQEFVPVSCDDVLCSEGDICHEGGCYPTNLSIKTLNSSYLSIYPNPTQNMLFTNSKQDFGRVNLSIYNAMGGLIQSKQIDIFAGEKTLLHEFNSDQGGLYFIDLTKDGKILHSGRVVLVK